MWDVTPVGAHHTGIPFSNPIPECALCAALFNPASSTPPAALPRPPPLSPHPRLSPRASSPPHSIALPQIKASTPKADVRIVGDLNMGLLPAESKATKRFQLVNQGAATAAFKIDYDRALPISITPTAGALEPGGEGQDVAVTITVGEPGSVAGEVTVAVAGEPPKKVMLTATVVRQSFDLVDSTGAVTSEVWGQTAGGRRHGGAGGGGGAGLRGERVKGAPCVAGYVCEAGEGE